MTGVYAIDGVEISAAVLRNVAYDGAEGVRGPGELKVQPLAVPGAGVRVIPGAGVVLNRFAGGTLQAYSFYEQVQETVTITATGSAGGRSDLVVARVYDPNFATLPQGVAAGVVFEKIQGVPASAIASPAAALAYCRALTYPALPLAGVTLPASTATVTSGQIRDLRQLARPRSMRVVEMGGPNPNVALTAAGGAVWPSYAAAIDIPEWATHVAVVAIIAAVGYQNGSVTGTLAVSMGSAGAGQWRSSNTTYDLDTAVGDGARTTLVIGGKAPIPAALRGTAQTFRTEGSRTAFTGSGALITRPGTHVVYDVQFTEERV